MIKPENLTDKPCLACHQQFTGEAALALAGNADAFHTFLGQLLLIDPRLTQDILGRPEMQRFLAEDRFQSLLAQARVQSMD